MFANKRIVIVFVSK